MTFLFDGDCGFCSTCARFIERRVRPSATVIAWQFADLGALGVTEADCVESVRWADGPGGALDPAAGPVAIGRVLRTATGRARSFWRAAGWLLCRRPVAALAWPVYRVIARNRHRLPGGTAACALPPGHAALR